MSVSRHAHRVLVMSDDSPRARRLAALVAAENLEPVIGERTRDGRRHVPGGEFLAVVVEERCLRGAGADVVRALREGDSGLAVIVDTGGGFPEIAAQPPSFAGIERVHHASDSGELALTLQRVLRARLEQRLAELEEHVVRVYASSQDGLMVLDPLAGRVIKTSPAAARLLEYVPSELIRLPVSEVFIDAQASLRHLASSSAESGRVYNMELHGRSKGGAAVPLRVTASVLQAGEQSLLLLLLRDLRPSQRAERAQRALNESEERLHAVFDHSPVTIDLKDAEGRYLLVNRNFAALHGRSADDIAGIATEELYARALAERIRAHERAVLSSGKAIEREYRISRVGRERTYLVVKFPILDSDGDVAGVGGIGSDITERKLAEAELALSEERFQGLYDNSPDMYFTVAEDGAIISVNQFGADYLGYSKDWLIGQPIWNLIHAEDLTFVREQFLLAFEDEPGESKLEFRMLRRDGTVLWVHERTRLFPRTDATPAELRVVCRDVTDAHDLSQELSYQATHDSLTGLVNRRELEHRLARVLDTARSDGSEHALCYLDLDQFKVINDTCGHVAGDELLRQLTEVLRSQVRKRDTLARLGGDEFGVLMEHCNLQHAQRVANVLRQTVESCRFTWQSKTFSVGVSIGLVPVTAETEGVAGALSAADTACYVAKDQGRNRIHVYHPEDMELARRHGEMQWVARINQALEENRFSLSAQAIRPLPPAGDDAQLVVQDGGVGDHFELLLRMRDDSDRLIPPGAFLPAAERYGLSVKIDRWVVSRTFDWLNEDPGRLKNLSLCCINLSGHSVADEEFLQFVIGRFDETGIPAEKICFEITETAAITNLTSAKRFITALKGWGCRFALDDFGSGLSSFAYLKTLPVDYLKIDGMFVKDVVEDAINLAMVRSINEIGKVLNKRTIAEFVENDPILEKLRNVGVDYVQGYRVGRPVPLDRLFRGTSGDARKSSAQQTLA